jgi:radical SAM protein with 4Fe4S-binding SPASM domain
MAEKNGSSVFWKLADRGSRWSLLMFHTELEATNFCNTRCLHCPHETITRPTGRMSWETYATVIEKIRGHAKGERFSVSFSGMGEPLLNPLLCRFIEHIAADAVTSFASNGAALTEGNVSRLIAAGLDTLFLSFNGDEPEVFARMMGGLDYETILGRVRRAVALAEGTRLKLRANISITKANQDRVSRIKAQLEAERVGPISFSLCHNRGGNLRDSAVCDTPPMPAPQPTCDVTEHTLFVDWQGRAHICDHDLHGEYELGDLTREPLATILARRQSLLADSSAPKICQHCNDIMRAGGSFPLASRAGGIFRDWIYDLYREQPDSLSEASDSLKWIYQIYEKEKRTDRFVNRLLAIEKAGHEELRRERADKLAVAADRAALARARDSLSAERFALRAERDRIQRNLEARDRQFAALHADYASLRRDWAWRLGQMIRNDLKRLRRLWARAA